MRISESRIRQIIREEAVQALREASDPRLDSKDIDQPVYKLISGLSAAGVEDVYPEAGELRSELMRMKRDFDQGMAIIRPVQSGGQDEFDVFLSYTSRDPINFAPIPRRVFKLAGISLDTGGGLSSAGAQRRGMSGFGESRRR